MTPSRKILFLTASASLLAAIAVGVHAQSRNDDGSGLEVPSPEFRSIMGNTGSTVTIEDVRNEVNAARLRQGDGIEISNNEVSVNDTVIRTFGTQTIDGLKIFTNGIALHSDGHDPIRLSRGSAGVVIADAGNALQDVALGNLNATGDITAVRYFHGSDARLKTDVAGLSAGDMRAALSGLRPVSYTLIAEGEQAFGLIAQEVAEIFPHVVQERADGMLTVDYSQLIAPMLAVIQGLERELAAERASSAALHEAVADMGARLARIEAAIPVQAALNP